MIFYYIPMLYLLHTRLKSIPEVISWSILYLFPIVYIGGVGVGFENILYVIFSVIFTYAFYEVGYIFNDVFLIKNESNPTMRLSADELTYAEIKIKSILLFRLLFAFAILVIFYFSNYRISYALLCGGGILLIYYFYNKTRSNASVLLYYLLIISRYCTPFVLFNHDVPLLILVMQPLLATFEYASKKKLFNDVFRPFIVLKIYTRAAWYFSLLSIIMLFYFFSDTSCYISRYLLPVVMLAVIFRGLILLKMTITSKVN